MLSKNDPLYYKAALEKLFNQAKENKLKVTLDRFGILFAADNGDRVIARV